MDRNFLAVWAIEHAYQSLSARRAWIEISTVIVIFFKRNTSLSARRAWIEIQIKLNHPARPTVALRKESVDRNVIGPLIFNVQPVALRKESVDRNAFGLSYFYIIKVSLSARRAWIEITTRTRTPIGCVVALRKESVDRNLGCNYPFKLFKRSLSARRAWIEIDWASVITAMTGRRSPQGERG